MPDPRLLQQLFEHASDLLCVAGLDGQLREVNPAWTRVLGWSAAELTGRPYLDFVHPDDREATLLAASGLAQGQDAVRFVNRYRCKDGGWRHLEWSSHPLPGTDLVMCVVRDLTEAENLRQRLATAEAGLEAVFAHAPMGLHLWEARADGCLILVGTNAAADRFTQVETRSLIGHCIEEAFPDTIALGLPQRYRAVAEGREPPFQLPGVPYHDGRIEGYFDVWLFRVPPNRAAAFFVEVTARMRAEEDLRITLDSIGDGVIATDTRSRITRINPTAQRLTGWTPADAVGRHVDEVFRIVNAGSGERVESPVGRVLREGQVVGLANHTALITRDGRRLQIADSGAPIRSPDGRIVGVVLVFRDVTEEYALQRQLQHAQKMEAVGRLSGGIAHDFNNLLGGILGAAELLGHGQALDERQRRWISTITTSATRAAELTQKLLAFGRKGQEQTVRFDLVATVHQVAGILEHTLDRRIILRLELPSQPVWLAGDPSQVQSAVLNLAINARDAMPDGGQLRIDVAAAELTAVPPCRHHLGSLTPGRYAAVAVTDSGCGIPAELLERIFEPFYTTKGPGQGSGLGLPSVYAAVQAHTGAITVDSQIGRGSVFTLYLPLAAGGTEAGPTATQARHGAGQRVLVVDDEPALREAMVEWLRDHGWEAAGAADGKAALAAVERQPPGLVLLDMVMPGMSGAEVFHELRARAPALPVLLMSGYNLHGARADHLLAAGAAGFLQKPFRFEDLSAAVARVLARG